MKNRPVFGWMLAATLTVSCMAGCQLPTAKMAAPKSGTPATAPGSTAPGAIAPAAPQAGSQAVAAQTGEETAAALSEEREMEDYGQVAGEEAAPARYLLQVNATATAAVKPVDAATPVVKPVDAAAPNPSDLQVKLEMMIKHRIEAEVRTRMAAELKTRIEAELKARAASGEALTPEAREKLHAELKAKVLTELRAKVEAELRPKLEAELKAKLGAFQEQLARQRAEAKKKFEENLRAAVKVKLTAELKAQHERRQALLKEKTKARLEKLGDARDKIRGQLAKAGWVENADGTRTKTLEFDVTKTLNGKTFVRKVKLVRTVNADGTLVAATADFTQTLPNGLSRTSSRSKTLQADGSYKITFNSEITLPDGKVRTASWDKTVTAAGVVTGTGKIEWKSAEGAVLKTVSVNLGGTEEAPAAKTEDPATQATTEVAIAADGAVTAEATVAGTTTEVPVAVATDGSVEATADVTATTEETAPADVAVSADVTATAI